MAVWTMQSGCSASSASASVVAATPSERPSPASSPASRPALASLDTHTPTSSRFGMGVDPGQGVAPDVAGAPLHDAIGPSE